MIHAALSRAEQDPVKLVTLLRQEARKRAQKMGAELVLTESPPVSDCPMIASTDGATAALIVVDPTVSGRRDFERLADLASSLEIPAMVCVNRFDLNPEFSRTMEADAHRRSLSVVGRIPYDDAFAKAAAAGKTIYEYDLEGDVRDIHPGSFMKPRRARPNDSRNKAATGERPTCARTTQSSGSSPPFPARRKDRRRTRP